MNFNIELWIFILIIVSTVIIAFDYLALKRYRDKNTKTPIVLYYAKGFLPVLLLVYLIRGFIAHPVKVPTGSLEPTIKPGDYVLVTNYNYALRLPILRNLILNIASPKRGDIIQFIAPVNPQRFLIKRLIGLPGDDISYQNKQLIINGKKIALKTVGATKDTNDNIEFWPVRISQENLLGVNHKLYQIPKAPAMNFKHLRVPKGEYFFMGDNRDNSDDGRYWGFTPAKNLIGKGRFIFFSWDSVKHKPRWGRIGLVL